jgi:hypothetical protein
MPYEDLSGDDGHSLVLVQEFVEAAQAIIETAGTITGKPVGALLAD